ncbi:hypothetical protein ABZX93_32855 [Streptomyces sp. NPDC006632]|uniref:hypothetical protein n=1 Tax=Streptomyces sp. NPDC006632 TaxID=3157182 RepID=UPI0033A0D68B
MLIKGQEPGTALLLAAAPANKGRLVDAASALPGLAAVPPGVLTGTDAASVVELADPVDPQTVLTRIRAVSAAPGPLSVYVAGQLHVDARRHQIHLALARTTQASLRYTAFPWDWLAHEFQVREPGTTTVIVDLVADPAAWQRLGQDGLALGAGVRLYGRVAPPAPRRAIASPDYVKAYAQVWRGGARPPLAELHAYAADRAGPGDALLLSADTQPAASTTPPAHARACAPSAGREEDAARREEDAARREEGEARLLPSVPPGGPHEAPPRLLPSVPPARTQESAARLLPAPPSFPPSVPPAAAGAASDPHPAILAAARAGRHGEAASMAAVWESEAMRTHGPSSPQALHWLEVRADLARLAREPARSCELWMACAQARLARGQTTEDADVQAAVDRAHHQWEQLRDAERARSLAPDLIALRTRVPGRQPGALDAVRRRLEQLQAVPAAGR